MAKKNRYHEVAMPWPAGLLTGNWVVNDKTLAEVRRVCAKSGEEVRVVRSYSR